LESPWLGLYKPLSLPEKHLLKLLNIILPNMKIRRKFKSGDFTEDAAKKQEGTKDPYYHGYISMRMIFGIMAGCKNAMENAEKLPIKTYIAYADKERVVSQKAIIDFAGKAGDAAILKKYESYHSVYSNNDRESYYNDLISFIDSRINHHK